MNKFIECPAHDNNLSANYKSNAPAPAGENLLAGTLHAGEDIEPGTLHAGEDIDPGTLHNS